MAEPRRQGRLLSKAAHCGAVLLVSLATSVALVLYLSAVDANGGGILMPDYDCSSDLAVRITAAMSHKGMALDDRTYGCANQIPHHWPHTRERVQALRLFRSVQPGWGIGEISEFANELAKYARTNNAKVLVGTEITCNEKEDDEDWRHTKTLVRYLGPSHVLGLAVGNELDILSQKTGVTSECVSGIWDHYLLDKLRNRTAELRAMGGFDDLPITSVFTGGAVWAPGSTPFVDTKEARVNTFIKHVLASELGRNWVFTLNFYPYFDPNLKLDADGKHCTAAMAECRCFDSESCRTVMNVVRARQMMKALLGAQGPGKLWVGEVGWSSPRASTLDEGKTMYWCDAFSGYEMLWEYYQNFLGWTLDLPGTDFAAPEMVFYFSMRDAGNFGQVEHFGLIEACGDKKCKLSKARVSRSKAAAPSRGGAPALTF